MLFVYVKKIILRCYVTVLERESLGQLDTYSSPYLETKDTNDKFDSNKGITQPRYYFGSYQIQV
jgi:hypothetical protein